MAHLRFISKGIGKELGAGLQFVQAIVVVCVWCVCVCIVSGLFLFYFRVVPSSLSRAGVLPRSPRTV